MPIPNSYRDPYWADLAAATETKLGLPSGLLAAIVTKGERSNHDQVSEAGAKTVFQIIPGTRQAAIEQYGIDPYLSPENAAEVAGRLLQDSLRRNGGDVAAAVAEYHGGTNRANWGPRTKAYVSRVVDGFNEAPSTFDRVIEGRDGNQPPGIENIYRAYRSGQMTPQEATEFEADVKSGVVMLPKGASLDGATGAKEPTLLPQAVSNAYASGQMSDQERADLEADMRAGLVKLPPLVSQTIPSDTPPATEQGIISKPVEPTIGERLIGAGEAGLSTVTGLTSGALGMVGGAASQIVHNVLDGTFGTQEAAELVEKAAMEGAGSLTYAPRTEQGRAQTQAVGNLLMQAVPIAPLAEIGALSGARGVTPPTVGSAAAGKAGALIDAVKPPVVEAVKAVTDRVAGSDAPVTPGTGASAGAMATDVATMRRVASQELPAPVELTKGQATRDFGQLRFEQEAAKNAELGGPIRERMQQQNQAVMQSFDAWIDETGAQAPDSRAVGIAVDKALTDKAARDKARIRVAYKEAEKAGELRDPVSPQAVVDALNNSRSAESTAPVLTAARRELVRLGGAVENPGGDLVATEGGMTLANMEQLRKFVNKVTGYDPTNVKFAGDLKRAIDTSTDGAGGQLYAKARRLRAEYAKQYENRAVIADLLNTKRGMSDRRVALEDVADRILFRSSLDDMRFARRALQTGGEAGKQAWREVQGAALRYIRDEATKGVGRDAAGNEIISAAALDKAIKRLDSDGKLDYLFGKQGAEKLRAINDLAKVMFTVPPGAVNTSHTASVLLAALDMAMSGSAGMPLPVMSGLRLLVRHVKDRKLRARIQDALNIK